MSKIYLAGHPAKRFDNDFSYLNMSPQTCGTCGGRVDRIETPLKYYWDDEFQSAQILQSKNRRVYWGNFLLIVPTDIRDILRESSAFKFYETRLVKTKLIGRKLVVNRIAEPNESFYWAKPGVEVVASVSGGGNETCSECGFFAGHPQQLTRLIVDRNDVPEFGIFSVAQNRAPQIFVTEVAKKHLASLGIEAGFYAAGRIE